MDYFQILKGNGTGDGDDDYKKRMTENQTDSVIQIILSLVLGISALLAFCMLRTRWPSLYSARKRLHGQTTPELPDTFFGWIPALWKVTEQQVLASAGLDAYVFLRFFKLAIKCLSVTLFFALVVFKPVHDAFPDDTNEKPGDDKDPKMWSSQFGIESKSKTKANMDYLYMYLVFAYVFTGLALSILITETERIINVRQEFLGSQCTVTDRTIRLSGIPLNLRSEEKIKEYIERLEIGKVESVTFARQWKKLDDMVDRRWSILRKLEESWTIYLRHRDPNLHPRSAAESAPPRQDAYRDEEDQDERGPLLNGHADRYVDEADRPKTTVKFGFLHLRGRRLDAIDYYEEKLRLIDEEIHELRKTEFEPAPLAFITLDSVAACQMAVQAVLDPSPMQLIAKISPAPADVVWRNTYMPRWKRMTRGWIITLVITVLTIFWSLLLVPLATAMNTESIRKLGLKGFADLLEAHPAVMSLVNTQLPTLISSLLFVIVPYLYDWLANLQGMTSQADIELSIISKNFFFVFFNYFVIFSVLGTFSNFWGFFSKLQESLKDTTRIAFLLAKSLQQLSPFYTNLIILQGVGLYPFRILQFGSVALYPIYRFWSKTPRDYRELSQPAVFSYGFYMPTVMLIFIICMVYSLLRDSWKLILAGLIYFIIGGFVTKYQLLYSMDHRQQSTGRSWVMICYRMLIGLFLFQLEVLGQIGLKGYLKTSIGMVPLLLITIWFSRYFGRSYVPLMEYISLGSIERRLPDGVRTPIDPDGWGEQGRVREELESRPGALSDESRHQFINPSLVDPLPEVSITDEEVRESELSNNMGRRRLESALNAGI